MAWRHRIWNVLRPGRAQRDLERELAFHLKERAEELQAAGISQRDAGLEARRSFGNFTSHVERTRDMDINNALEALLRNLRLAGRGLMKTPAFTATVIFTLAIGIGANSAVFSAIDAVLLRPSPFPNPDRLVKLSQSNPRTEDPYVAPPRLEDWNRLNSTFQAITGYYAEDESELSGELPEKMKRALVAPRFLEAWGVAPILGRDFSAQEMRIMAHFAEGKLFEETSADAEIGNGIGPRHLDDVARGLSLGGHRFVHQPLHFVDVLRRRRNCFLGDGTHESSLVDRRSDGSSDTRRVALAKYRNFGSVTEKPKIVKEADGHCVAFSRVVVVEREVKRHERQWLTGGRG